VLQIYLQDPPLPRRWSHFPISRAASKEATKHRTSKQRLFKSLYPVIPIVPRPVRQAQSAAQKFLHDASDLDPISDVLLLKEMIINHLAQMIFCEESR
jgi:hypothetical protein